MNRGVSEQQIKKIIEKGVEAWTEQDELLHNDKDTWYIPKCSRRDAEIYLADKPTGTFLIRPSSAAGSYALSIACNGVINHCMIHETPHGFGFAIPYNLYPTLESLVLHYAQSSLEEHNDLLPTTLKYPIYSPYIQRLQK